MTRRTLSIGVLLVTVIVAFATAVIAHGATSQRTTATPMPKPSQFSARVDNPWFPLKPGTIYTYRGVKDGVPSRDVLTVTHHTRTIAGVPCVVIEDRLYLRGQLEERTTEWYSQDNKGNVWYLGEDTAELDKNGHVKNTDGTWRTGRNGAKAGIFMFAEPKVGASAQQEYYKGQAEDHFQVLRLHASVKVPYLSSGQAMLTKEWTPLEPGTIDHKFYVRGVGNVLEQTARGGNERNALISLTRSR
ncbi:MAG: hypothetical protein QOH23_968 [Gaiellaceae bacterium]|jgi:hypothetical protein|nr:hypothetical protein [Gaiellaceae bacterium]